MAVTDARQRHEATTPGFSVAFSACVVVLLATSALAFGATGAGSRWKPTGGGEVAVVDRTAEAPARWEALGVRNAVLVQVSADLGFQTVPLGESVVVPAAYPFPDLAYRDEIVRFASAENYVWIATQRGTFRQVQHVLPPAVLEQRVAEGLAQGYPGISADRRSVRPNNNGFVRVISAQVPAVPEPVVLHVDASYFESVEPQELLDDVHTSGLNVAVLTANRSVESTSVSDHARQRLDLFVDGFRAAR